MLFAAFSFVFSRANKNFGYFVMVCFPAASDGLAVLGSQVRGVLTRRWRPAGSPSWWTGAGRLTCAGACIVVIAATISGWLYSASWSGHRFGLGFHDAILPVRACDFLERHRIDGRLLNSWDDGGYIHWATERKVFIYGHSEVVGQAFYDEYVRAKHPEGLVAALRKWQPTVVLVPIVAAPYWLYHFDRDRDWRLVYADDLSAIFLHASVAPQVPALPRPRAGVDYPALDDTGVRRLVSEAAAKRTLGFWQWLEGSDAYPLAEVTRAGFLLQVGEPRAAIGVALAGVARTPFLVPDLMLTLGHAFEAQQRYDLADICFDAFTRVDRDPALLQDIQRVRGARRSTAG
jgi:hypothetical protein